MKKQNAALKAGNTWASVFALAVNFALFLVKLFVGISSNSLSVYCDSINNLGDSFSCAIAVASFLFISKKSERKAAMTQALASFVIGLVVGVSGCYFAYCGAEKFIYPTLVSYSIRYAVLIVITIFIKLFMGFVFLYSHKKSPSPVTKTLMLDSFMDSAVTFTAFLGFSFTQKVNFAVDGLTAVIIGAVVAVCAFSTVIKNAKFIVNS